MKQATSAVTREQQLKEDLRKQLAATAADSKRKVLLGFHEASLSCWTPWTADTQT